MKEYVFLIVGEYTDDDNGFRYDWRLEIHDIVGMYHYLKAYVEVLLADPSKSFIIICNLEKTEDKPYITKISKDSVSSSKCEYLTKLITNKMCPMSITRFFVIYDKMMELNKDFEEVLNDPEYIESIDEIMDNTYNKYNSFYYDKCIHDFNILDVCSSSIQKM